MWARLKQQLWDWRGVWLAAPALTVATLLLRYAGGLQLAEWTAYDMYLRWRPAEPRDERIAIVGVTETDLQTIGQAIVPDAVYAELLNNLAARQPRAIGFDIFRDLPVPPGHEDLVAAFETVPNLIGIEKAVGDRARNVVPPPPALAARDQVGIVDTLRDADGRVRRSLLYFQHPNRPGRPRAHHLSLYLALIYLQAEGIQPEPLAPDSPKVWRLGETIFRPLNRNSGGYARTNANGYQLLLNYRGGRGSFETRSLTDVLEGRVPDDWGRDRIILIGSVADSLKDTHLTPYSGGSLELPEPMPGVEIIAHQTSQLLDAALSGRSLIRSWPEPVEWLWIGLWASAGAALAWQSGWRSLKQRPSLHASPPPRQLLARWLGYGGAWLVLGSVLLGSTWGALLAGWWLPVVPPALAALGSAVAVTSYVAYNSRRVRQTFGRYLSDRVVATLLEQPQALELGGKRQCVTILTSDLRGFTAIAERLPPEDVVRVLNIYLQPMLATIVEYDGTIAELMGDGIFALFGVPTARPDDAGRAVACAIAMQLAMEAVNAEMRTLNLPTLEMGIGINTGECIVGNVGSEIYTRYGAIGSQVNLAFRIESYATGRQVLISAATLEAVGASRLQLYGEQRITPKGIMRPLAIYEVGGIGGDYNLQLPVEQDVCLTLATSVPILYVAVEGKQLGDTFYRGDLVALGANCATIAISGQAHEALFAPLSNLKFNLLRLDDNGLPELSEDAYAKVLTVEPTRRQFDVRFTYRPPGVGRRLQQLWQQTRQQARL